MKIKSMYIKTFSWEYWPMWLVYLPASFYCIYLFIKARSFFFFSAANPTIETGGMFFESKWKIFELIPKEYFPSTILIEENDSVNLILSKMKDAEINFPIIAKPDRGERGWYVKKINSKSELIDYRKKINITFLIQTFVNYPIELSIFYYRNPNSLKGEITSVTMKKLLTVKGDGKSTIQELMLSDNRSFLQYKRLKKNQELDFNRILKDEEELVIVPYGNHVLGAMFKDYTHIVDAELTDAIDLISKKINGFYFGRFDLKCQSIEDLKKGKNISILELNGAGAEPAHIYDPNFSFFKAQFVLIKYFKNMYIAAYENNKKGVEYMTYKEYKHTRKLEKEYKLKAKIQ